MLFRPEEFPRAGAAASIGLINALGTLGGFVGPYMIGASEAGGDFAGGLYLVGCTLILSAVTIVAMGPAIRTAPERRINS